jgi:hypothetical protein
MPLPPPRRVRTTSAENPFASFYESRRKISLETDGDTADPSSSITRAYIVPDDLLELARGEHVRMAATNRSDVATESTSMFPFRSPQRLGLAEWRAVQRMALQLAGWLRRAWRRSIPN